ncbi:MAG: ribulose-phosphate 3-epimerase [Oscillospiraceae bacterium]|nr:ribulose-phosphate 3-epimerase [Oscillospiraceae bacterium]
MKRDIWTSCAYTVSLITLDHCNLETQVRVLEKSGVDLLHVDILDGHFSPSMPLGLETVRQLRTKTDLAFDCHIMTDPQDYFIDELLDIGVQQIVFHAETQRHIDGMLNRIHARGVRAGVALKPSTPLSQLDYVLEKCDCVLLMLINPGFASAKNETQVPYAERKIRDLREMIEGRGLDTRISLDGRISRENVRSFGTGLADQFVLGSTCLRRTDLEGSLEEMFALRKDILKGGRA